MMGVDGSFSDALMHSAFILLLVACSEVRWVFWVVMQPENTQCTVVVSLCYATYVLICKSETVVVSVFSEQMEGGLDLHPIDL